MRRTKNFLAVTAALMANPDGRHWGYELSRASGVRSGAMYPMLSKLLDLGWLTDGWETPTGGRPPRRYYELTDTGRDSLAAYTKEKA